MRSLVRWTSLAAGAAVLYVLGVHRLHLYDFNAFLAVLFVVAGAITGTVVITRDGGAAE